MCIQFTKMGQESNSPLRDGYMDMKQLQVVTVGQDEIIIEIGV